MNMDKLRQIYSERKVTDKEFHLIEELRKLPYGETHIIIFNEASQPVRMKIQERDRNILL